MDKSNALPAKMKSYLKHKGFNMADIARKANLKPDDLYNIFSGRRIMTADIFVALCKAIGVVGEEISEFDDRQL